jgi:hypothetical protein
MRNSGKQNFLVDGFPRNKDNVDGWQSALNGKVNVQCVLFFDCDEQVSDGIVPFDRVALTVAFRWRRFALRGVLNVAKEAVARTTTKKV